MDIRVIREHFWPGCTIGRMLIDGVFECYTLEDGIRTNKVHGETAIPVGRYPVSITRSTAFKCRLPLLGKVPNFSGIRIHPGNASKDTQGCILVGQTWAAGSERIGASRLAFDALFPKIEVAIAMGETVAVTIEQVNAPVELAVRAVTRRRAPRTAGKTSADKRQSTTKRAAAPAKTSKKKRVAARTSPARRAGVKRTARMKRASATRRR